MIMNLTSKKFYACLLVKWVEFMMWKEFTLSFKDRVTKPSGACY